MWCPRWRLGERAAAAVGRQLPGRGSDVMGDRRGGPPCLPHPGWRATPLGASRWRHAQSVSHSYVFAAGDCAASGTTAESRRVGGARRVRHSQQFAASRRRDASCMRWRPQKDALAILGLGDGTATGLEKRRRGAGRRSGRWKDWIDRRWMGMDSADGADAGPANPMRCGGRWRQGRGRGAGGWARGPAGEPGPMCRRLGRARRRRRQARRRLASWLVQGSIISAPSSMILSPSGDRRRPRIIRLSCHGGAAGTSAARRPVPPMGRGARCAAELVRTCCKAQPRC